MMLACFTPPFVVLPVMLALGFIFWGLVFFILKTQSVMHVWREEDLCVAMCISDITCSGLSLGFVC